MATGTITFRPSRDVNVSHSKSSGSSGYALIADTTADDNSSYIYQSISSTSNSSVSSTFVLTGNIPSGRINVTAVRLYSRAKKSGNGETASYNCYFAINTTSGGSSSNSATSATLSSSYSTSNESSSELVTQINNYIDSNNAFPSVSVKITSQGSKYSSKDSDGYVRITQIYMEVDYETIEEETPKIFFKNNNTWNQYSKVYKKQNGSWVEISSSDWSSIFDTNVNYVKG